jgi:outer membrane immunogenic protein
MLVYATGGLAVTDLRVRNFNSDNLSVLGIGTGSESSSNSDVKAGWTVGGGVEVALDQHWSLKAEYLFVDFNKVSTTGNITSPENPAFANPLRTSEDLSAHLGRVGLNFRF